VVRSARTIYLYSLYQENTMQKYRFSHAERYAVWLNHEKRCWLCNEPLRLLETTIDHVVPECLLEDEESLQKIVDVYELPSAFEINGFENWLPCHNHCNQSKSSTTFSFVPGYKLILDRLIRDADKVARSADAITKHVIKDKLFAKIFVALEKETISLQDIKTLVGDLGGGVFRGDDVKVDTSEFIKLDNGYWLHKEDVVAHGICTCERDTCVDHNSKVMCVWGSALSDWVARKRLYWKCYDEIIECPRCHERHKRGHVGSMGPCQIPFKDQVAQRD